MIEMSTEELRELYLADLRKEVCYDGKDTRPRVRKVSQYENIPVTVPDHTPQYENIFVWSDTHFGHKNIIKYCDRPFWDLDDMSQKLIDNHNNVVGDDDLVIWVGDVAFMNDDRANEILSYLKGDRILIIGNHDMDRGKVKNLDFKEKHLIYALPGLHPPMVFTHYPLENCPPDWINVHGHIHNNHDTNSLQHINVSVEVIDYTPMHWHRLVEIARTRWDSMER
jgi:calcineurin-like phosphoesterase family protein